MKTAFITGAATGIGLATATKLARQGWIVGLFDVNQAEIDKRLQTPVFEKACGSFCDVTDRATIRSAFARFSAHTNGRLDLLVNNAGVLTGGKFEQIEAQAHDAMIEVNVKGLTNVAQLAFPMLKATAGASMVNLCSTSSVHGIPLIAVYSATKFYVNGLTEALNLEWKPHDIHVTCVKPPVVPTAMGDQVPDQLTEKMKVNFTPEKVADAVIKAASGKRPGYVLGWESVVWSKLDRLLPWFARRSLLGALSGFK